MTHLFLTGASGFVGSAALQYVMENTDWTVTCPVTMRHHGDQLRILPIKERYPNRIQVVACDLSMPFGPSLFPGMPNVDYIWNIASESHVDRSLTDPAPFIRNNTELMINILEFARRVQPTVFMHMSTDEVFGPLYEGEALHHEWAPIKPSNPYSASKAAQEAIAFSYWRAFGVPLVITNTMNLIGPRQHPEKFVPKVIRALKNGDPIHVHASPEGKSGSRFWIGVEDFASAWLYITQTMTRGIADGSRSLTYYPDMPHEPARYNVVGTPATNLYIAQTIADIMGVVQPNIRMVNFHTSRPGHDMHYGLDGSKLADLGWQPNAMLDDRLIQIVHWYQDNPEFLEV